ncbi:MAG: EAL domain-containing response regulator [Polyangiaceae bacterium]|nr:EAL domain-containing response regulator [Polyangiaceae bacterium]
MQSLTGVQVLIVEDEAEVRRVFARLLESAGASVTEAGDAISALTALLQSEFDVVVTDVGLPGADGLSVLRSVRENSLDTSCIILTGRPEVRTAVEALRLGAFDYLNKAEAVASMRRTVARAATLARLARLKREAQSSTGRPSTEPGDLIGLDVALTRAIHSLWMAYQPIVRPDGSTYGYEALMRSQESTLPSPGAILSAAERLGRTFDVGRKTRCLVGNEMPALDAAATCFVNLHPRDMGDPQLYADQPLLERFGQRVVLEVTERESLDRLPNPRTAVATLRESGCRIAVDDLGAGYAGLTAFAQLEPDIVKIDMSLVRDIDRDGRRAQILGSIVALCHDLGVTVVAEGIETVGERDAVLRLGCDLFQGYLFARPAVSFTIPSWPPVTIPPQAPLVTQRHRAAR